MNDMGNVLLNHDISNQTDGATSGSRHEEPTTLSDLQPHPILWQFRVDDALNVLDFRRPTSCTTELVTLQVVNNELRARDHDTAVRIHSLVKKARQTDTPDTAFTFVPSVDQPVAVKVACRENDTDILVLNCNSGLELHVVALIELFDLTAAEVRLTQDLVEGLSLKEIATRRGVSTNTVRAHLKNTFLKTRTNRQADLIKLALMLSISF